MQIEALTTVDFSILVLGLFFIACTIGLMSAIHSECKDVL